jgi:hypothetical protein
LFLGFPQNAVPPFQEEIFKNFKKSLPWARDNRGDVHGDVFSRVGWTKSSTEVSENKELK